MVNIKCNHVTNGDIQKMINRISEIPFWGPEEQIRKFVNQHDEPSEMYDEALRKLGVDEATIASLTTVEAKQNELKTRVKALAGVPNTLISLPSGGAKFSVCGI